MTTFLVILQVLVAFLLIGVVLLQPGNKGGMGAALGGAGGETVFGGRGANTFLAKITFGAAVLFMVTNFTLSFLSSAKSSVLRELEAISQGAPAVAPSDKTEQPKKVPEAKKEGEQS